jgi:hypothetical protein
MTAAFKIDQMRGFPPIERVEVHPAAMARYTCEGDFVSLSFDLLREVASYACVAACILGPAPTWTRDQAAIGGNMVRLFKILSAFLDQTAQKRRETGETLARLAFETIVNVRFLVKNFHPATIDSYVRRALRHERQLRDKILSNIENRRGDVLPIERRMLNSIDRTARIAGISLETIDPGDKTHWAGKSIYQKANELSDLDDRLGQASHAHEEYLCAKPWPQI